MMREPLNSLSTLHNSTTPQCSQSEHLPLFLQKLLLVFFAMSRAKACLPYPPKSNTVSKTKALYLRIDTKQIHSRQKNLQVMPANQKQY